LETAKHAGISKKIEKGSFMTLNQDTPTNVLIAEDDDDDYLIFSIAIAETSLTLLLKRAENGEILLKLLDEQIPDILFLDLLMPCTDGRQCLREIRANKKYDTVPIIVYSSLTDLQNIEYCYREGSNLYVIKPNSIGDLKSALERIFSIDWKKKLYFPQKSEFVINA
jgi:CheY-like chemotaxis protein